MNLSIDESKKFINKLNAKDLDKGNSQIVLCPSFISILLISELNNDSKISLGAQNIHFEDLGAYTGEVSAKMLKDAGAKYVIIGHSERREFFAETDESINAKMIQAVKFGLIPILCIGELISDRQLQNTEMILRSQLQLGLENVNGEYIIAYEPIWAIGSGQAASCETIASTHKLIRKILRELNIKENVSLLYGGSVSTSNASEISKIKNVDGFLIGGASLNIEKFYDIYLNL